MADQPQVDFQRDGDFPDIDIEVSPIGERSRTIFAKTHNRIAVSNLEDMFEPERQ